jgi:hypothetical protein
MVRIDRRIVIGQMASAARRRDSGELAVLVAIGAGNRKMRSRQREGRLRVTECRRFPRRCGMTLRTRQGELSERMVRIDRRVIGSQMASTACRRDSGELPVLMAISTANRKMCARQRECRLRMTERRGFPCRRRMALRACLRELRS